MDDALYLLAHLAFTDDDGEITAYMTGYGLNAADPGEISISCNSLEQAQDIFLGWLPEEADVRQDGETLSWNMSDTLGIFQGTAVLKAGGSLRREGRCCCSDRVGIRQLPPQLTWAASSSGSRTVLLSIGSLLSQFRLRIQ